ncbi:MAG: replicative DNA helicase [Pseudomonadota bacterium]
MTQSQRNGPPPRASSARIPPHAMESEQAVLGALLIDPKVWDSVAEQLTFNDFYHRTHQLIFKAMEALVKAEMPIDAITVSDYLRSKNQLVEQLQEGGGFAYLAELSSRNFSMDNIHIYVSTMRERTTLRELVTLSSEIAELAFNYEPNTNATVQGILDTIERRIFEIAGRTNRGGGPVLIRSIVSGALLELEKRMTQPVEGVTGLSSGLNELDNMTSGLHPSELTILAARPSMGKTALAMNIVESVGRNHKPVLVFSMEMSAESLVLRMFSASLGIDQGKIRTGRIDTHDWEKVKGAVTWMKSAPILIDETPGLSPIEMRSRARRVLREHGLSLIVIDYLQLMQCGAQSENRTAEISEISRSLKAMAKELKVPVIALSQLNRSLELRPNKRPIMSDLRESGAIEQDADLIMFIYRDEVYCPDTPDKGTAEVIIGKHRNGPTGMFRLAFNGQYTRFANLNDEKSYAHNIGETNTNMDFGRLEKE